MAGLSVLDKLRLRAMKRVVKAAHRKKIDLLVAVGRSASTTAPFFSDVWQALYPREKSPMILLLQNFFERHMALKIYSDSGAGLKLLAENPVIGKYLATRIMLYDEMAQGGSTLRLAKAVFERAGAKRLTTAALFSTRRLSEPFFPGEPLIMLRRPAQVIGMRNSSVELVQKLSYWKAHDQAAAQANLRAISPHAKPWLFRNRKK